MLSVTENPSTFLLPAFFDGGNAFPPTSTQSLRASVPSCEVPPFYRKEFSSPVLSTTAPADRPASPTDRQAPRIPAAVPPITSPTSSAEPREGDFHFDESACKWPCHAHAGIPKFRPSGCNPGDPPPTWSYLQPLTRHPESAVQSISAAERSVVECAWRWVPSSRPPAASFQNKSFGRPWGGFLGAPRLKALSSSQWGTALEALHRVVSGKMPSF
jgi:hypothetical protein